ncbi:hypothetical protein [Aeromonas hydrophila]|uniref:hypothetical protein n=1 Tax=Aeromonas hydrophila TaxID=644 RepID=UPI003EC82416
MGDSPIAYERSELAIKQASEASAVVTPIRRYPVIIEIEVIELLTKEGFNTCSDCLQELK